MGGWVGGFSLLGVFIHAFIHQPGMALQQLVQTTFVSSIHPPTHPPTYLPTYRKLRGVVKGVIAINKMKHMMTDTRQVVEEQRDLSKGGE